MGGDVRVFTKYVDDVKSGIQDFDGSAIGVCLTVPYGFVADKYGRKPVLILSLVGLVSSIIWQFIVCKCVMMHNFAFPLILFQAVSQMFFRSNLLGCQPCS